MNLRGRSGATAQQRSGRSRAAGLPRSTPTKSTPTHSDKMESELGNSEAIIRGSDTARGSQGSTEGRLLAQGSTVVPGPRPPWQGCGRTARTEDSGRGRGGRRSSVRPWCAWRAPRRGCMNSEQKLRYLRERDTRGAPRWSSTRPRPRHPTRDSAAKLHAGDARRDPTCQGAGFDVALDKHRRG